MNVYLKQHQNSISLYRLLLLPVAISFPPNSHSLSRPHSLSVSQTSLKQKLSKEVEVGWNQPPDGWIKINRDGAAQGSPGLAGCGGLVRNDKGE